jgi:hypothetical protein
MSLPKICTCPTVPAADCPFHHQQCIAINMMEQDITEIREMIIKGGTAEEVLKFLDTPKC